MRYGSILHCASFQILHEVGCAQSSPTLCNPIVCSLEALQAILEWVAMPSLPRRSFQPRDWTQVSHITGKFFTVLSHQESPAIDLSDTSQLSGEGNGNPLQYSCLENPMDRGAWWAAVYGVTRSRTRLKRLSSSSQLSSMKIVLWSLANIESSK